MSTYAVLGMTRQYANEWAKDKTPTKVSNRELTEAEWLKEVGDATTQIMKSKKMAKLSPMFDAPQFAREFILMASKDEHRDLCIKARCPVKNQAGTIMRNPKNGNIKMQWMPIN